MAIIEIDGKQCEADSGQMIIEVADKAGIHIPRFCYHKKLSIAANCRMCLVEVAKGRKPVPACATPITDGMQVFTRSKEALHSQKAVMEFLLINHPLDCPICDQGGECELQDVAMGYGKDVSRFTEGKRSVYDQDIGPLIATDMTRCIHCTRCVRFGEEVAGLRELGAVQRGEEMNISTYVSHSMQSEVSGNIIDLCPVGALTNKPYRFTARPWELKQTDSIAAHDCWGSNVHIHSLRQKVMRVVPKENEAINETWLSDRDRFSYLGLHSTDRLSQPMLKQADGWQTVEWQTALQYVADQLKQIIAASGPEQVAGLVSPNATLEECYVLQKMLRALQCRNIDHRIRELDFADQKAAPLFPGMQFAQADLEQQTAIVLVGSNLGREQPLAAIRVRKAALHDAKVFAINPVDYEFNFPLTDRMICPVAQLPETLAQVAKVLMDDTMPADVRQLLSSVEPSPAAQQIADQLRDQSAAVLILGEAVLHHPRAAVIRALARWISQASGAKVINMTDGANSAGAWLAGAIPHRMPMGTVGHVEGLNAQQAWQQQLKAYVLLNIEPELDCADSVVAQQALHAAEQVIVMTPYVSDTMKQYADVILPITPFAEMSGTLVNVAGEWQRFRAAVKPHAAARPAWKVLRVLSNLMNIPGFDYMNIDQIHTELVDLWREHSFQQPDDYCPQSLGDVDTELMRLSHWGIYRTDNVVRRSDVLQQSGSADEALAVRINSRVAARLQVEDGGMLSVQQQGETLSLQVVIDERIADDTVSIVNGFEQTQGLGAAIGSIRCRNDYMERKD